MAKAMLQALKHEFVVPDVDPLLAGQCVRFLYRNLKLLLLTVLLITSITLYVFWNTVPLPLLLLWGVLSVFVLMMRAALLFVYSHLQPPEEDAARWGGYFTLTALASGLLWAAAVPLFFEPGDLLQKTYITMMILGMASGAMTMTVYWPPAFHNFVLPPMATLCVYMIAQPEIEWVGLGVVALTFLGAVWNIGRNQFANFAQTVRLQSENLELIRKLREQKARAEQANRSKTQFLAAASHDLRQPVHSLALFADALRPEVASDKGRALLANLSRSVESIDQLLSSLLDISKLDAGVVKVNAGPIALQPMLQRLYNEFYRTAEERGLRLVVHDTELAVHSDPILLTNIVRNLVSNALRYTRHGGVLIGCRARRDAQGRDAVVIEVWDTGRGIPESEHEKIFAEFYQLDNPERDRGKGLGLGLAICQRLCRLLGHRLELASRPGRGSVFRVWAPRVADLPLQHDSGVFEAPPAQDFGGEATVLVVDDEKDILAAMQAVLSSWNCRVLTAGGKTEALERLEAAGRRVDLLICDYRLRDNENGSEVIAALRARAGRRVPAIIMTGDTAPERLREAQASGHTLLHKPVRPAELRRLIDALLRERAA